MTNSGSVAFQTWRQSRYGFAGFFLFSFLLCNLVLRFILFSAFKTDLPVSLTAALQTFGIGLYRDFFVALALAIPLLLWLFLVPNNWFGKPWHRALLISCNFLFWTIQSFIFMAEFFFFEEFRSRFNTVSVDYIMYPHEVFVNLWDSYPVLKVALVCILLGAGWVSAALKFARGMWETPIRPRTRFAVLAGTVALAALLATPFSLKGVRFSQDRMLNEFANNGALAFAAAAWTHHLDYTAFYRTLPAEEAYSRARKLLGDTNTVFTGPDERSITRKVAGDPNRPRLNVVLCLEESFGSEFWGSLGRKGKSLTPEMDKLAVEEGMFFTNIYACGNRTVRGLEGVLSSFPPLPGDSIVKRDLSENVETIARVLKRDGYNTLFMYGGRGIFDGMRSFAVQNGFDRFFEQKHFEKPTFTTVWGVADEDLFSRAVVELRELSKQEKPFFTTILSVSNHKPFTYPSGRIPEDPNQRRRENAVKYSDFALGQFFRAAKKESYWTNTIFVVIADHGARVYGSLSIPIGSYEIPLVVLGPAVVKEPVKIPNLGGSLDVSPTILGLIGRPYESVFFGNDILHRSPDKARIYLNHNRDIGVMANDRMVVLGMRKGVEYFEGDPKTTLKPVQQPTPMLQELERDTEALYQVADDLYINRRYRVDAAPPTQPFNPAGY
ncbi:MAG TPA: sulfatase-like hydrolase/transferase [Candidatus Saccharimonadales bacterium]|nr:sulfatase-like hydrolase/transferase [Candidatus Saccharimonadales bacterium]